MATGKILLFDEASVSLTLTSHHFIFPTSYRIATIAANYDPLKRLNFDLMFHSALYRPLMATKVSFISSCPIICQVGMTYNEANFWMGM
jgi:hypothetical protein